LGAFALSIDQINQHGGHFVDDLVRRARKELAAPAFDIEDADLIAEAGPVVCRPVVANDTVKPASRLASPPLVIGQINGGLCALNAFFVTIMTGLVPRYSQPRVGSRSTGGQATRALRWPSGS
jgi:hypothetical protein